MSKDEKILILTEEEKEEIAFEKEEANKANALSGFIISIAAHVFGLGIAGLILSIIGLVTSSKGLRSKTYPHKSLATVGRSISTIEIVLNVVNLIVSAIVIFVEIIIFTVLGIYLLLQATGALAAIQEAMAG